MKTKNASNRIEMNVDGLPIKKVIVNNAKVCCTKCNKWLGISNFSWRKQRSSGILSNEETVCLQPQCNVCRASKSKKLVTAVN